LKINVEYLAPVTWHSLKPVDRRNLLSGKPTLDRIILGVIIIGAVTSMGGGSSSFLPFYM